MIRIHHLGHSQSERILWLCEELGLEYDMVKHVRDPLTRLSPPSLKALHPLGAAPLLETEGRLLAESGAIVDFILARHGQGRLQSAPDDPRFADYLYWFHLANGNLQPTMMRAMVVARSGLAPDHPLREAAQERLRKLLALIDERLAENAYLAGDELTAADIMSVFSLTTMRLFCPVDLAPWPSILAYLRRVGERPAYRRAMAKGDPDLEPLLA